MPHSTQLLLSILCLFINGIFTNFTPTPPIVLSPADYIFLVAEESPIGTSIGRVNPTSNENGISLSSNIIGTSVFAIDTNYDVTTTMSAPDYEIFSTGPIQFQIEFTYTFQTYNYVITSNITVFVTDVNDNTPEFVSSPYSFYFTEDLTVSSLIGFVSAYDKDSNPFNCIEYSVTPPINGTNNISITEEGGVVILEPFTPGTFEYEIVATDSGEPPQSISASLEIIVSQSRVPTDVVDPILQQTEYHFFAREDVSLHANLGTVAANRNSSIVTSSSFLYSVAQGEDTFQIDTTSGILSNQDNPFDFDSGVTNFTFPVIVKLSIDGSGAVQSKDTSPINVYLRNVNEHPPVVTTDPFSITMSADVSVGSVIGLLPLVTDMDGQNNFNFSFVTDSPFRINDTGFVYLISPLDTSISSYSLTYQIEDKPLLSVTRTTSATLSVTVSPASVPPEQSLPTRSVSYTHSCDSISSHSFAFAWLSPTDNSNPTHYNLSVTCTFTPLLQRVYSVSVPQPFGVVVVSDTFDRFTECEYLLSPFPVGPSVQGQMEQLSFNNQIAAQYFIQITNRNLIFVQISNISMCLTDLYGNVQIFDTQIFLSSDITQVAQFDASYANYYDSGTETLSLVGHLTSGSDMLQSGTNYSVSIQFPVNVNQLYYQWYTHVLVPVSLTSGTLGWTQTCTPAFYTFSQSDISIIDQSCPFVFIHASTANSFYQSLLPSSEALSITVRDTLYGTTQWDSDVLATIKVTQLCHNGFTPLYSDDIVQQLFLMRPGYTLTDITTADKLELTVHPMFICSLYFATPGVAELTAAFQATHDVTMSVSNDTTSDGYTCAISTPNLNQLTIYVFAPNSQTPPAVEFDVQYPLNLTLECDWSLTPGGVYRGIGSIEPLSSFRLQQTIILKLFTFQIDPIDDNQVPKDLLVPYGTINGDTLLPKGQHVTSSPITLPDYFLIGSLYSNIAYVSNKGVISFGYPFTSPYPEIFPGYSDRTRNAYIVAPFWANIDTTFLGDVSWQLHSDAPLLSHLSTIVGGGFSAQSALAVTWHKVRPFPAHGGVYYRCLLIGQDYMPSCTQHNTFQAVVLSDGSVNTHVLFSYNCADFDWSKSPFNAAIGFNAGGSFFNNHHLSTTNDVNLVPCSNPEGTEYPQAVVSFRLSSTPGEVPTRTQSELCRDRIASATPAGVTLPSDYTLRSCPADLLSAQSDFRFFPHTTSPYCVTPVYPASDSQSVLCCYSITTGTFLSHLSTFLRYSPLAVTQYATHEEGFFSLCCATRTTCEEYYQVRPKVSQDGFENSGVSSGFGDPHFVTFDGFEFTFNRIGEFVLTSNGFFEAQIRATQFGTFQATYTSAIVLQSSTSEVVQIEVAGDTIVAYTTGRATLTPPNFPLFHEGVDYKISYYSANQILVVFSSGVSVLVALKSGALTYHISLPLSYRDTLSGLLGNWNGNQSDEHVRRDGVLVDLSPLTPLEREMALETFGGSWAVTTSLFQYPPSESTATYTDTNFVPLYLSNLNVTPATNICGSSTPCLYDFSVTNDTILATNTLQAQNDISALQSLFATSPPTIRPVSGEMEITVKIDVWYEFLFEVFDPQGVYRVGFSSVLSNVELELSNNLTDFRKYYTLKFRVSESEKDTIFGMTVWVQSRTNLVVGFSFILSVCDCNFGVCSDSSFTEENFLLQYAKQTCVCDSGYTGETCSEDFDACDNLQCYPEVLCVDLSPPSLVAECATCPNGTTGDGQDCEDYNECVGDRTYTHNCSTEEYCRNVIGSFECVCIDGYERSSEGVCEDIDECDNPVCHQNCVNTVGSYFCDCVAGLTLSSDTISCEPIVPCATSNCDTDTQLCAMISTNEICFCKMGFMPSETNSFSCLDSNECGTQICTQGCENNIGGYSCSCESGYSLSYDNRTCADVNECVTSATCEDTFICSNLIGSFKCVDPLNPFPFNSSAPVFVLDVPAIVAGSIFAGVTSVLILLILIYILYKDYWRLWRRRGWKDDSNESELESGTNFNIFRNH